MRDGQYSSIIPSLHFNLQIDVKKSEAILLLQKPTRYGGRVDTGDSNGTSNVGIRPRISRTKFKNVPKWPFDPPISYSAGKGNTKSQ